jgi:hypothetical protein
MPHIPERWDGSGYWYFVTVVTLRRQPVFAVESACKILQNAFHEAHRYHPFRLAALVVLPDHWHALIRPGIRKTTSAEIQPPTGVQSKAGTKPRPTVVSKEPHIDPLATTTALAVEVPEDHFIWGTYTWRAIISFFYVDLYLAQRPRSSSWRARSCLFSVLSLVK